MYEVHLEWSAGSGKSNRVVTIGHTHTAHEELLLEVIFDYPKLSALLQLF